MNWKRQRFSRLTAPDVVTSGCLTRCYASLIGLIRTEIVLSLFKHRYSFDEYFLRELSFHRIAQLIIIIDGS